MANPPFNVDGVQLNKIKGHVGVGNRLPFGLPGTAGKSKKKDDGEAISNANSLWLQYFYSYLNDKGRAGFVMASSASDAGNKDKEIELAVKLAIANANTLSIGILFKNRDQENLLKNRIPSKSIRLHREMSTWQAGPGIRYGTYHSAKGLEFDMVILPFLSQDDLPDSENIEMLGRNEALAHDGRLLYVAVTRAKTRLVLTYSGNLSELLPTDLSLYRRQAV